MKKTFSFAIVHFTIAFSLGYLVTGSVWVAYHVHELAWQRRAASISGPGGRSENM